MAKKKVPIASEMLLDVLKNCKGDTIELDSVFLDPNNPRYFSEKDEETPDDKIMDDDVQSKATERIFAIGISDLHETILNGGFIPIDRVVVKPIKDGKYVVVEGNRRVATLKRLIKEEKEEGKKLLPEVKKSIVKFDAVVYQGDRRDIAWVVQGLRHLSAIKKWPNLQQARFLVSIEKEKKLRPPQIAKMLGMKPTEVAVSIRSYHAMEQAKENENFGDSITPEKFSIFQEAVFKSSDLQQWLGWDEENRRFNNPGNLEKLLSWIIKDPEEPEARITRAIDVRDILSKLVQDDNKGLLSDFELGNKTIDQCRVELSRGAVVTPEPEMVIDLTRIKENITKANASILTLPIPSIKKDEKSKKEIVEKLTELKENTEAQIENLK